MTLQLVSETLVSPDLAGGSVDALPVEQNVGNNTAPVPNTTIDDAIVDQNSNVSLPLPTNAFFDAEGDVLTYSAALSGGGAAALPGGSNVLPLWLSIDPMTGTLSGVPGQGDVGLYEIIITATDPSGLSASQTFFLTVNDVNDAPFLQSGQAIMPGGAEDQTIVITQAVLLAGFTDVDGDTLSVTAVSSPNGALVDNGDGTWTFTPADNYNGMVLLDYSVVDGKGGSVAAQQNFTLAPVNDGPVLTGVPAILAGGNEDQDVVISETELLAGYEDIDGGMLSVATISSPNGTLVNNIDGAWTFTPDADYNGVVTLDYTIVDGQGGSLAAVQTFSLAPVNDAPVAGPVPFVPVNGVEDQPYLIKASDILSGYVDIDGDTLSISAISATNGTLADNGDGTWTFTPTKDFFGSVTLDYTVSDGQGGSMTDQKSFTLTGVNDAPESANFSRVIAEEGTYVFQIGDFAFTDVDPSGLGAVIINSINDGGKLFLNGSEIVAGDNVLVADIEAGQFSWTGNKDVTGIGAGNIGFSVKDNDGNGNGGNDTSGNYTILFSVNGVNDAPVLAQAISSALAVKDNDFALQLDAGTFKDVDSGDILTWSATLADGTDFSSGAPWLSFDPATHTFTGKPGSGDISDLSIKVTVTDLGLETAETTFTLKVVETNTAPQVVASIPPVNLTEDAPFDPFSIPAGTFFDADSNTLSYVAKLANGDPLPAWLQFDGISGTFSSTGTPPGNADVGQIEVTVTASDGAATASTSVFINIQNTNDAPELTGAQATLADGMEDTTIVISAADLLAGYSDPDVNDSLSVSALAADKGTLVDNLDATWTFTPAENYNGSVTLDYMVVDKNGGSIAAQQSFNLAPVNDAPTAKDNTIVLAEDNSHTFSAADFGFEDIDNLELDQVRIKNVSGAGTLYYDGTIADPMIWVKKADLGKLVWTPDENASGNALGSFEFIVYDAGLAISQTKIITFNVSPVNDAPEVLNPAADQLVIKGTPLSFPLPSDIFGDVDAGDNLTLSASLASGDALPAWLTFDPVSKTFSGTPGAGDVGAIEVLVTATDGGGLSISDVFVTTVADSVTAPFVAKPIGDQTASEDSLFQFTLPPDTFTDLDGNPVTLSATLKDGSPLPAWLKFDPLTATFSGTPDNSAVGMISVKVTGADGAETASDIFTITIGNTNDAPVLEQPLDDQDGSVNVPFQFQVPAGTFGDIDLDDQLTLSFASANANPLPSWLQFDPLTQTFTGTPDANGTFDIEVTATDMSGATVSDVFSIVVDNISDAPTGTDLTFVISEDAAYTLSADNFGFKDANADNLVSVKINAIKGRGTLTIDGVSVEGKEILAADLGKLTFTPGKNEVGDPYCVIDFTVKDDGSLANGGVIIDPSPNHLIFAVDNVIDIINGDKNRNTLNGTEGGDKLNGKAGNDRLNAFDGNDLLIGGAGKDRLFGGAGDDVLNGGASNDKLTGGEGSDTFMFRKNYGVDTILDFDAVEDGGHDILNLVPLRNITGFNDLAKHHMEQVNDNVVINAGNGDKVILKNVLLSDLDAGDFLF